MCPPSTGKGASVSSRTVVKKMAMSQSHSHHDQTVTSWKFMEAAARGYKVLIFFYHFHYILYRPFLGRALQIA